MTDTNQEARETPETLLYRPNEGWDDWGMIRTASGKAFATVTRPLSSDEAAEHRRNGTDPFEDLARSLMSALASAQPPAVPDAVGVRAIPETLNSEYVLVPRTVLQPFASIVDAPSFRHLQAEQRLYLETKAEHTISEDLRTRDFTAAKRALASAPHTEPQAVLADVRALVIAARAVAFGDAPSAEALRALDTASEAFASRVPWEDEP